MRKLVLFLSIAMILFLIFPAAIVAQTADSEEFDPEGYFARYGYINSESPVFYATRSGLAPNEMHILDTLTRAERQIIEESFDPPAIGVIRDLSEPVYFNLNEITIPESGEISQFGGRITRVDADLLVYTTYFQSKKADEIRLFFSEGNFPPGVKVNLFSRDDYAFTQPELRGTLDEYGFYTTTTFADYITLQVVMPITQIEENVYFTITKVIHADDRYIPEELIRSCFLDANCADANSFAHIDGFRRATARLSFPSGLRYGLCTGTQLNDLRAGDFQPFLLTANHCFDTQTSAAGLEARFYYWSTSCNSGAVNPNHIIVNGSNLIATNSQTDFTLILLKEQGGNFYMGWDAGSVSNNTVMHSVHHPGGTLMKYHRMLNKTSPSYSCTGLSTSNFLYTKVTLGQEAPGSSGGGVVDPDGRIRGQLYGTCHDDVWDNCDYGTYYNVWGKFGVSYANNNLQYWLSNGGSSVAMSTSPASSYSFGTVNVGSYQNYNVTVYNTGTRPNYLNLEAGNAYISGGDASQFSIIGSKFLYLAPGESGTFTVRFTPTSSGKKTTSLNIPHNANNYSSPKVITLTGYGNPCSDIISLGSGGSQNIKTFSKSGEGAWTSNFCGYVCNGNEQIYSFTAPVTGAYSITVTSTNNTWIDYFWKSTACSSGGWNCINYIYSPSTQGLMNFTAGTTYYILLDAEQTALATHSFFVALNPCSNIISISGTGSANSKTYAGGGYGSWYTSTASACGYYCVGQEQVYSFVAPRTGNYAIQVTSGGSWVDYMWKSGSCASAGWQCIDDIYSPGLYGEMYWNAGETYYLLLDDEDNTVSNHTFYIQLTEALGTWTGLVNTDWHNTGNWSFNVIPDNTIDVVIPNGTPHDPVIQNTGAACKSLTIESDVVFTIGAYSLNVTTDVNVFGQLVLNNTASKLYVYQDIFWQSGATANAVGSATIFVQRTWDFLEGCNVYLNAGYVDFFGTEPSYIRSRDADSYFNHVRNNKAGSELGHSAQSLQPCRLHGNLYIYSNCSFTSYTSQSFIIGSFVNNMSGIIHLNSGTFVFDGGSGTSHFMPGDYFNNITFSATGTTTFDDNIEIRGDVLIESGTFNPGSTTLTVKGNWTNTAGDAGFTEGTSRVIFNGTGHNYVKTSETFNILEANMGAALRVDNASSVVTCNQYDWTSGGIDVMAGTFTALDLYDNGIFGGFWLNPGGTINLTNSDGYVDLAGNVNIYGGNFNVYGGTTDSYWPWSSNASITMSAGVLDFKDVGIYVNSISSYTLTENIIDGAIKTSGNFYNENPVFTPSGGTVELYGSTDVEITNNAGTYLHNLTINKSGGSDEGSEPLVTRDRNGKTIVLSRANQVTLNSDIFINGNLTVNAGKLNMGNAGYSLICVGSASIENGATLEMQASSKLKLNTSLMVKNGGTFRSTGSAGLESLVTNASLISRYLFDVQSGANIGASNTIFEYMGANGINIASGAVVDPAQAFNNCTFRQGLSGNTLLTINSTQTLECTGAIFPANTWGGTNNVKKSVNSGRITFYDYSGSFAGSAYESDPYSRVDWFTPQLSASPLTLNVNPPAGAATINVTSNLSWTATESSPWFSISPLSGTNNGTITVTYNQNTSAAGRSGTITISAPDVADVTVTVVQAGATLSVTPATRSVSALAGSTTFSVGSNTSWTVSESVSWFSVSPMSGTANGTLTVNYDQNTSTTPRSGQITVSSAGLPSVVVTVNQAGAGAALTVTPANRDVTPSAGSTTFSIASNTGWVVTESVAWLTAAPMSGTGNGTLAINYNQNATGTPRVGSILVTASGGSPAVTVTVSQSAYSSHAISLSAGWQGLSSYIMPANNDIDDIFAPILSDLILASTFDGGLFYPAGPINTIGAWMSQSAYSVKMENAALLSIFGMPETDKTYDLSSGWNLIPVITNNPVNVATLPTTIGFQIVKDVAGAGVYWPAMSINTVGNLLPGKAYYVRVTSGGTITFPANTDAGWSGEYPEATLLQTPWNQPVASPVSHLVAFVPGATAEFVAGDIIGLFTPDNICCGVTLVEMPGAPLAITAFADDAQQPGTSGYLSGQTISLKIYHPATNEVGMLAAVYEPSGDGDVFAGHGLSVITHIRQTATGIGNASSVAVDIYPNPTDGSITITGIGQYSLLQLYSAHGELLLQRTNDAADELRWDVSALPPGVYQLKLSGNHPTVVKKLIRR